MILDAKEALLNKPNLDNKQIKIMKSLFSVQRKHSEQLNKQAVFYFKNYLFPSHIVIPPENQCLHK